MLSLRMALMTHMTLSLGSSSVELEVMLPHLSNTHINVALQDVNHHLVWAAYILVVLFLWPWLMK